MKQIHIKIVLDDPDLIPLYGSLLAAGADVRSASREEISIAPGKWALIPTGVYLEIPPGYEVQVRSRSGLAAKHGVSVLNAPGTIDADYRGEVKVILINQGEEPFFVTYGMRIAQLVVAEVVQALFAEGELSATVRGSGGFGHTGIH